jgi:hypothetical protein
MPELIPPEGPFLLQGPATDVDSAKLRTSAAAFRRMYDSILGGRQGVIFTPNSLTDLKVTCTGSDMTTHTAAGRCAIKGTQAVTQGMYEAENDADDVLTLTAAHATLPRYDAMIAHVYDEQYSGATSTFQIEKFDGVPGQTEAQTLSALAAAVSNYLLLATVLVPAAASVIPAANVNDKRVAAGLFRTLIDSQWWTGAAGPVRIPAVGTLPPAWRDLFIRWKMRSSVAAINDTFSWRANGDASALYNHEYLFGVGASGTPAIIGADAQTAILAGIVPATNSPANEFAAGEITIFDAFYTDFKEVNFRSWSRENIGAGGGRHITGGGVYRSQNPITFVQMILLTGPNLFGRVETYGDPL